MLVCDWLGQHDYLACATRRQYKTSLRCVHVGQIAKHRAKSPNLDSQPRAMRLIGELRSERSRDQRGSRYVSWPRFPQCARKREQHQTFCKRRHFSFLTHEITASVYDECFRLKQHFDVFEEEKSLLSIFD